MGDWMDHIKFYSVCCWALTLNDCWKHQSGDHFPSFTSERLVAPLTAPPLMDLRILKCITINVIWDTQSMTCVPGDKHGQIAALQHSQRISLPEINNFWGKILLQCRKLAAECPPTQDLDAIAIRGGSDKCLFSWRGRKVCTDVLYCGLVQYLKEDEAFHHSAQTNRELCKLSSNFD